ncbi:MAG: cytochrome b [Paracoccaceae bacterium]
MQKPKGYSKTQIALHWGAAAVIALQFILHDGISDAWDVIEKGGTIAFSPLVASHVAGGFVVLGFVVWRLVLRFQRGVPALPAGSGVQHLAAHVGHFGLYALMVAVPISGAVAWFGGVSDAADAHEVLKTLLLVFVAAHVAAALLHQFWLKDGLLLRMRQSQD